jgi:hypothetical protein
MSYARFGPNSDVYVYADVGGYLNCCGCILSNNRTAPSAFDTTAEMLEHLEQHKAAGHQVPDYCISGLKEDAEENDKWLANYDPDKEGLF